MATFKEQVQGLTGLTIGSSSSSPTNDQLTQFLKNGVIEVINRISALKPGELVKFSSTTSDDSDDGITLTGKILSIVREHQSTTLVRPCTLIPSSDRGQALDKDSLQYRTKYNPAYYILDKKIHSIPESAGSNNALKVTQVHYDQTVAHGSDDMQNYPTEYIYLVPLYGACQSLLAAMGSKVNSLPLDLNLPSLDTITTSLPSFSIPEAFSLPDSIQDLDVNLGGISLPTAPTLTGNSVIFNESPPVYTGPTTILDFADANNWINVEEDSEMSGSRIQVISTQLQEFTSNMQNELNSFNADNNEYQAELQKAVQDSQLSSQDDAAELQKYQAEVQAYQTEVTKELQKYQAETGLDLSKFQADLEANAQKFQNDLTQNKTDFDSNLTKYSSEVQKVSTDNQIKISKFNAEVQDYTSRITKISTDYQWLQGKYSILKKEYDEAFLMLSPQQSQQQEQRRQ
jgi:hypothetical protein